MTLNKFKKLTTKFNLLLNNTTVVLTLKGETLFRGQIKLVDGIKVVEGDKTFLKSLKPVKRSIKDIVYKRDRNGRAHLDNESKEGLIRRLRQQSFTFTDSDLLSAYYSAIKKATSIAKLCQDYLKVFTETSGSVLLTVWQVLEIGNPTLVTYYMPQGLSDTDIFLHPDFKETI